MICRPCRVTFVLKVIIMNFMLLKNQLENDLKAAMRAKDGTRLRTLRMVLAAIKLAEVEKGADLDEAALTAVLHKEIKLRQEAIAEAQRANRPDLVQASRAEVAVLEEYLPRQLSVEELEALARQAVAEAGASSAREMGQVMKILMPRLQGRASGSQASEVVRRLLS